MHKDENGIPEGQVCNAPISDKSVFASPLLLLALFITSAIAIWGLIDTEGLACKAAYLVALQFTSRAWFIMSAVSFMLIVSAWLAVSRYGSIRLGSVGCITTIN